jgi:hypothetical protein
MHLALMLRVSHLPSYFQWALTEKHVVMIYTNGNLIGGDKLPDRVQLRFQVQTLLHQILRLSISTNQAVFDGIMFSYIHMNRSPLRACSIILSIFFFFSVIL